MTLNKHQIAYGVGRVTDFSNYLNIPKRKVIDILLYVNDLRDFYNWVDADDFIIAVENEEILLEEPKEVHNSTGVVVYLNGKDKPAFKCSCGCNVFHHPDMGTKEETLRTYDCNACGTRYTGE